MHKSVFETAPPAPSDQICETQSTGARRAARWLLAAGSVFGSIGLLALAGCPGNLENPQLYNIDDPAHPTAGAIEPPACAKAAFAASCSNIVGCHKSNSPAAGLDLETPGVTGRMLNVASTHQLAVPMDGCIAGQKLIDPTDPEKSWLWEKLVKPAADHKCGLKMPPIAPELSADDLSCINKYIKDAAGAASTGSGGT